MGFTVAPNEIEHPASASSSSANRRLTAILFADVAGYSRLMGADEEGTLRTLNSNLAIIEKLISEHGGRIFGGAGDSVAAEFPSPVEAVRTALAIQESIRNENLRIAENRRMQFRIGVHMGDVLLAHGNPLGDGVNIAARLQAQAEVGGILVSGDVYRYVRGKVHADFDNIGARRLKNIAEPVQLYSVQPPTESSLGKSIRQTFKRRPAAVTGIAILAFLICLGTVVYVRDPAAFSINVFDEGSGPPLPSEPSIAVLPLKTIGDSSDEYFGDGLTTDISGELSKFKNLFVVASYSAFTYKDKPTKVQVIGDDLGVRYLLQGTVQRANNRVRVSAQLVDAESGRQLWSERYDEQGHDIFAIQDNIIETVVTRLAIEVDTAEKERVMVRETENAEAYDHYLRGRKEFEAYSKEGSDAAKKEFLTAIELDPGFARAYSWLGYTHLHDWREGWSPNLDQSLQAAFDNALKATKLVPDDYYTHWTLAQVYADRQEFTAARGEYDIALSQNSNDPDMLVNIAEMVAFQGDGESAVNQIKDAQRLNPKFPPWYLWSLGIALFEARRYDEAVATLEQISDPANEAYIILAVCLAKLGKPIPREELMARLRVKSPDWTPEYIAEMPFEKEEDRQHWVDGLILAGILPPR